MLTPTPGAADQKVCTANTPQPHEKGRRYQKDILMYHSFTDALIHTQEKNTLAQHLWPETLQAEYSLQHC